MPDNDTRVTLAVLATKLEHMQRSIDGMRQDRARDVSQMQSEIRFLSSQVAQMNKDTLKRIVELEKRESASTEWKSSHKAEHIKDAKTQRVFAGVASSIAGTISAIIGVLAKP